MVSMGEQVLRVIWNKKGTCPVCSDKKQFFVAELDLSLSSEKMKWRYDVKWANKVFCNIIE